MDDIVIDKIMKTITAENIDEKLLFYSSLLEQLMNKKECYDININSSVKQRACKERFKQSLKPTLKSKDFNERLVCNTKPTLSKYNFDNEPNKKIKMEFLELVSDEDSSSDYIPSEIDSDSE